MLPMERERSKGVIMIINLLRIHHIILFLLLAGYGFSQIGDTSKKGEPPSPEYNILDYKRNHTLTYKKTIAAYHKLADKFPSAKMVNMGPADCGKDLFLFMIDQDEAFNPRDVKGKAVLMINNGIHPGEPCGVDGCINFANDLLKDPEFKRKTKNLIIGIIPIYNIGGSINRGCCSRANQNGPEEYGFRGNARNLDLNRDFVKMDSENAKIFARIFHRLDPDVLVDTHTSNGADYQYTMTLLTTQLDKLNPALSEMVKLEMLPDLYSKMNEKGWPMVPYVNTMGPTPESGIYDYMESPRYCTGYGALFNTIGFTTETHMWKPFADRVQSTYDFLDVIREYTNSNYADITSARDKAFENDANNLDFDLSWKLDTSAYDMIEFLGYETEYYKSEVTGLETYRYNREKPWKKEIRYYNRYTPVTSVKKPEFYVLPQAWKEVIARLKENQIEMAKLSSDTSFVVSAYFIEDHKTGDRPYEGHYLHREVKVRKEEQYIALSKGDFLIPTNQKNARFIIEMLEPHATDSYFAWNFFDEVLQQKEYFSHYIFEEKAAQMLKDDPELANEFRAKQTSDEEFAKNHWMQLYWIYKRSDNYEPSHMRYPVYRID